MDLMFDSRVHRVQVNYDRDCNEEDVIVMLLKSGTNLKKGDSFHLVGPDEFNGSFVGKAFFLFYDIKEDDGKWLWAYPSM